jgi:hypothetical protein
LNPSKTDKFHLSIKGSDKKLFMRELMKKLLGSPWSFIDVGDTEEVEIFKNKVN